MTWTAILPVTVMTRTQTFAVSSDDSDSDSTSNDLGIEEDQDVLLKVMEGLTEICYLNRRGEVICTAATMENRAKVLRCKLGKILSAVSWARVLRCELDEGICAVRDEESRPARSSGKERKETWGKKFERQANTGTFHQIVWF